MTFSLEPPRRANRRPHVKGELCVSLTLPQLERHLGNVTTAAMRNIRRWLKGEIFNSITGIRLVGGPRDGRIKIVRRRWYCALPGSTEASGKGPGARQAGRHPRMRPPEFRFWRLVWRGHLVTLFFGFAFEVVTSTRGTSATGTRHSHLPVGSG